MFTRNYWAQVAERAIKSAAQALIGLWPLDHFDVLQADWELAGGVALGAAVLSILFSLVTSGTGQPNSPSAVPVEPSDV